MSRRIAILGTTARQELIEHAATRLSCGRAADAHLALEAVVDGARLGTIGGAMLDYYLSVSDLGLERLIRAVERRAGWHRRPGGRRAADPPGQDHRRAPGAAE